MELARRIVEREPWLEEARWETAISSRYSPVLLNGGGMYLDHSTATLINNQIISNTATGAGAGAYLWYSNATLSGNTFVSNTATYGAGLSVAPGDCTCRTAPLT